MRTLLTRLAHMLFVLWAVATILFFMFRLMPGDPTAAYIDTTFTEEQVEQLKKPSASTGRCTSNTSST